MVMKRLGIAAIVLAWYALGNASTTVSLTGTVTDTSNSPISKARLCLKKDPSVVAYTNDNGVFTFATGIISSKTTASGAIPFSIRNNRLVFSTITGQRTAGIEVFSLTGAKLSHISMNNLMPGSHSVQLAKIAQGTYLIRLSLGNQTSLLKVSLGKGYGMVSSRSGTFQFSGFGKSASSADIDTLIVVAHGNEFTTLQGYRNKLYGLSSYNEKNIAIKLTPSNPWVPTDYHHAYKNMLKVHAKAYDFEMGQPDPNIWDIGFSSGEQPVHTVQFTYDYWMDSTEVTQKDFATLMAATYSNFVTPKWDAKFGLGDNYPAYLISWADAVLYCNARSKRDTLDTVYKYDSLINKPGEDICAMHTVSADTSKNGYRLPTEAEWEYACKGGIYRDYLWNRDMGPYPASSSDSMEISTYAVWGPNAWDKGDNNPGFGTHEVGGTICNNYGLYDMAGNVSEFCHDDWANYSYGTVTDPVGPVTEVNENKVARGGNWGNDATYLRSANRYFDAPNYHYFFIGFRVVKPER